MPDANVALVAMSATAPDPAGLSSLMACPTVLAGGNPGSHRRALGESAPVRGPDQGPHGLASLPPPAPRRPADDGAATPDAPQQPEAGRGCTGVLCDTQQLPQLEGDEYLDAGEGQRAGQQAATDAGASVVAASPLAYRAAARVAAALARWTMPREAAVTATVAREGRGLQRGAWSQEGNSSRGFEL